jgi:hypothetical protein
MIQIGQAGRLTVPRDEVPKDGVEEDGPDRGVQPGLVQVNELVKRGHGLQRIRAS